MVFKRFTRGSLQMDSHQFSKFCADAKLYDDRGFTKTDAEILFREVKNVYLRKISFVEFNFALEEVAKRTGRTKESVMDQVCSGPVFTTQTGGPSKQGGPERFFYDRGSFTGVHRHGGPTTVDEGRGGQITNISQIVDRKPADRRGVKMYDDVHLRQSIPERRSSGSLLGTAAFAPPPREAVSHAETRTPQPKPSQSQLTRRRSMDGQRLEFTPITNKLLP
jgi:hypothetical protein